MAQPESQSARQGDTVLGKPNIVFILLDNVGWGDFGVYGGLTPTPRVGELARQGIRFNNYNVESQCTPTRAAILPRHYSVRSGTYTVPFPGQGKMGLASWEYTIPKLLSDSDYTTAMFGKCRLSNTPGRMPNEQGFHEWWGHSQLLRRGGLLQAFAV